MGFKGDFRQWEHLLRVGDENCGRNLRKPAFDLRGHLLSFCVRWKRTLSASDSRAQHPESQKQFPISSV